MRLNGERYETIKGTIADFFEDYDIKTTPIDVLEIARKMNIVVVFSSSLIKKHPRKIGEYQRHVFPNSFVCFDENIKKFVMYIDDIGTSKKRQRFSIAHELAHIILNHEKQSSLNESEANFAATYILAPSSLVLLIPNEVQLLLENLIQRVFDVSKPESKIIKRRFLERTSLTSFRAKHYEKRINELLKEDFIEKIHAPPE